MNAMSGGCGWYTIINNLIEEAGVVLRGRDTHVCKNLSDQVVPVLRRLPQVVESFV